MTQGALLNENPNPEPAQKRQPVWFVVVCFLLLTGFIALIAAGYMKTTTGAPGKGSKLPALQLTTFDGKTIHTADLNGTVVVVNFWASWCTPCQDEAAALEAAWQKYRAGGKVVFLGVDYMDTESQARRYLDANPSTYPNGPDAGGRVSAAFRVRGVPETYIFDRDGLMVYSLKGPFQSADEITIVLDSLVGKD
jgi:cytochrome c biogenesis protein CcmG, thiol:disulfide interchange protein DsbE